MARAALAQRFALRKRDRGKKALRRTLSLNRRGVARSEREAFPSEGGGGVLEIDRLQCCGSARRELPRPGAELKRLRRIFHKIASNSSRHRPLQLSCIEKPSLST